MKRFLLIFTFVFVFLTSSVQARTVKAMSIDAFSTAYPGQTYSVELLTNEKFKDGIVLEAGTILTGNVMEIQKPRHFKRNGNFEFVITAVTYKGETQQVKHRSIVIQIVGYRPLDPVGVATYVGIRATNLLFMGASEGIAFVQGFTDGEDESRYKSGFIRMYKESPLAWVEVGKDLDIHKGDLVKLKFKNIR